MIQQVVIYTLRGPVYCRLLVQFLNVHIYYVLLIVHNMSFILTVPYYRGRIS
jgi:hypothetical protein